jgi:hypothetical protein
MTIIWTTSGGPSSGQPLEDHHLDNYRRTIISPGLDNYRRTIIWTTICPDNGTPIVVQMIVQ